MPLSRRLAFTLVEVLCALVLVAIVGTTIGRLLIGQQRFYASVAEQLAMRSQLRDGADVLSIALRHAAVQGAPIALATDSAVELSSVIGAGTLCGASGAQLDLAPESSSSGAPLTTLAITPDSADDVLVYAAGSAGAPPQWRRARIVNVTTRSASAVCAMSPLLSAVDLASARVTELTVTPALPLPSGAPIRVVRHVRFSGYRAGDGFIYLGYRRCALGCNTVQPVSGPYGTSAGGVLFRYFDATGAALATPVAAPSLPRITRIDVVLRAPSRGVVDLTGVGRGVARDSTLLSIGLRNAP